MEQIGTTNASVGDIISFNDAPLNRLKNRIIITNSADIVTGTCIKEHPSLGKPDQVVWKFEKVLSDFKTNIVQNGTRAQKEYLDAQYDFSYTVHNTSDNEQEEEELEEEEEEKEELEEEEELEELEGEKLDGLDEDNEEFNECCDGECCEENCCDFNKPFDIEEYRHVVEALRAALERGDQPNMDLDYSTSVDL